MIQTFKENGIVRCVKCGWIAVDIPAEWNVTEVERVGFSTKEVNDTAISYNDIALNGRVVLHVFRSTFKPVLYGPFQPYFFEKYPC